MKRKRWLLRESFPHNEKLLRDEMGLCRIMAKLLVNRGAADPPSARYFLYGALDSLEDPFAMTDMEKAVTRILRAIDRGEKIAVYGDYDVDGITATATVARFFTDIGVDAIYHIPSRSVDGYGLNPVSVTKLAAAGVTLIITVDNGISAFEAVDSARDLGVDIVITDHHQPSDKLPNAYAVINPLRSDCAYPCKTLAGVGLAFKLCSALRRALYQNGTEKESLPNLKRYLDMVAIGSVADCSPLTGENRLLAKYGLMELNKTDNAGLLELARQASLSAGNLAARDISFGIAPRINSAGRLGAADIGFELLMTKDHNRAGEIVGFLESENKKRQTIQQEMFEEVRALAREMVNRGNDRAILLGSDTWHPGVAGIVASKLVDEFYLPAALVCFAGDFGRGSARSIPSYNLMDGLSAAADTLTQFGGHKTAAGFSVHKNMFENFRKSFTESANESITQDDMQPVIDIDCEIAVSEADWKLANNIGGLAPFGEGNPTPVFLSRNVRFSGMTRMGQEERHVRLSLENSFAQAIGFSMSHLFRHVNVYRSRFDIVYTLEVNTWRDQRNLQFRLLDIDVRD